MDEARYRALMEKRDGVGLTDEEADELGALLAEKSGEAYGGSEERSASEAEAQAADDEHRREKETPPRELIEEEIYDETVNEDGFLP
jgi:hypothetical protein